MDVKREFIFPMNYKNKEKFLGIIDYKIVAVIVAFSFLVFYILKKLLLSLVIKVVVFILIVGFLLIFFVVGVNGENMLDFLGFMIKFAVREKIYVYRKIEEVEYYEKVCKKIFPYKKY